MTWKLVKSYGVLLLVFLVLVVCIQLLGIPGTSNRGTFEQVRGRTFDSLELVSGQLAQRVAAWCEERRVDVSGLASGWMLRRAVETGDASQTDELAAFVQSHPSFQSVRILPASETPASYRQPGYTELVDLRPAGDQSRLRIVRQMFSTKDPDTMIGVVIGECLVGRAALPMVTSVDLLRTREWDCIIAGPQAQPILQFLKLPLTNPESFAPLRQALSGTEAAYDGPAPGRPPVLAFGRQITLGGGKSLALVLIIDRDKAYATAADGVIRLLLFWLIIFVGGIALSVLLARQISRPLRQLADAARLIESGDLEARAVVDDKAEIGQLAQIFNGMVTRLKQRQDQRIRLIADSITGGMLYQLVFLPEGGRRFTYLSDSVRELYGVSPEEATANAQFIYQRVLPEDLPELLSLEEAAEKNLTTFRAQARMLGPDGNLRWSQFVSTPTRLDDGSVCWDGIEFVITEQMLAQQKIALQLEEIREKELQFHSLADSGLSLIWRTDAQGRAEYFNTPWLKFTGQTLDHELGDGWLEGVHPDDLSFANGAFQNALAHREHFEVEYRLRTASGDYRWIADMGTPRYSLKGEFQGFIGHCYDITDKRRAAETLQRNEKLESLGVLAGGIAHDFNNLLAGVFAYLQLARSTSNDAESVAKYLDKALGAFQRAKDLTRQLLTFAKGGEPVRQTTDLRPLVEEAVGFALSGSSVTCVFEWEANLRPCDVDINQMAQVVDNIVINALQAMPLGGTITITGRNLDTQPPQVRLSVADTGLGIPPHLLSRIFDPFFTTKQKGTGLGLATTYSILQKHGGTIDVESQQGQGTVFHLTLPVSSHPAEPLPAAIAEDHRGQGTVLVMDDEEMVRDLAGQWLTGMGYTVVGTRDGDETLAYLAGAEHLPVACVLLDLTIPGGRGGLETLERLRPQFPDLPVFASSGYSEDPVMARPTEYGFTGSIAKPYLRDDLVRLLNRFLRSSASTQP